MANRRMINEGEHCCSFCGRSQDAVTTLISGPNGAYICDICAEACIEILDEECEKERAGKVCRLGSGSSAAPREIKAFLDEYVVGQEKAKKVLSVAVYNHYKRLRANGRRHRETELTKSNILLIGPTGSGKTFLAQTLAKLLDVPFASADATSLTSAGYVGEDVETMVARLVQAAGGDIKKAQHGIIYIDEIDKIARAGGSRSASLDVTGEGVQQALLKILEGTVVNVPMDAGRKFPGQRMEEVDTTGILFICGGAFEGMEEVIGRRRQEASIGFNSPVIGKGGKPAGEALKDVRPDDLVKFGMIPEFVGRIPVIACLDALDEETLLRILKEPKNSLVRQYTELFGMDGVEIYFDDDALEAVAALAMEQGTGARGLKSIVEDTLLDLMYDVPSEPGIGAVTVTKDMVEHHAMPVIAPKRLRA